MKTLFQTFFPNNFLKAFFQTRFFKNFLSNCFFSKLSFKLFLTTWTSSYTVWPHILYLELNIKQKQWFLDSHSSYSLPSSNNLIHQSFRTDFLIFSTYAHPHNQVEMVGCLSSRLTAHASYCPCSGLAPLMRVPLPQARWDCWSVRNIFQ